MRQSPARAPQRNQRSLPAQGQVRVSLGDSPPTQSWGSRCSPGWSGANLSGAVPRPQVQERDKKCRGAPAVIQLLNPNQNTENSTEAGTTRTGEGGDRSACTLYTLCTKLPPNPGPGPPPRNQLPPAERKRCSARRPSSSSGPSKVRIRNQNPWAWQGCSSAPTGLVAPCFPEVVTEKEMRGHVDPTHAPMAQGQATAGRMCSPPPQSLRQP